QLSARERKAASECPRTGGRRTATVIPRHTSLNSDLPMSLAGGALRMRPSSGPAPYRLFELAEVEGRRVGKLLLCQISCELRLAANLDLIHGHGNQLVAETE